MNTALYIFKRISLQSKRTFSRLIVKIAVSGIAIGLAVILITFAIVNGFQKEIPEKISGFWGQIQISKLDLENNFESKPVPYDADLKEKIESIADVDQIQTFALKGAIAKTKEDFEGVLIKGVEPGFKSDFFASNLKSGRVPEINSESTSNEVLIPEALAKALKLDIGSSLNLYFIQDPPRVRKFQIAGIYGLGIEGEFGEPIIIADMRHIRKLNAWNEGEIGGYEVFTSNYSEELKNEIEKLLPLSLYALSAQELFPALYSWLDLFNVNKRIILIILILVAGINMISALIILILERTKLIGLLKSFGMPNFHIQSTFLFTAAYLIFLGLIIGNALGLGTYYLQINYGIISLPEDLYFVSKVPMYLALSQVLMLNLFAFVVCIIVTVIPVLLVSKISPVKAIRFS